MEIAYLNQPMGGATVSLGTILRKLLHANRPRYTHFFLNVAFLKRAGLSHLAPGLKVFRRRHGRVLAVVGVHRHVRITTKQGLRQLLSLADVVHVFNNPSRLRPTYHPKVYMLSDMRRRAVVCIGSSNVTEGGLFTNYEGNVKIDLDLGIKSDRATFQSFLQAFKQVQRGRGNARKLTRRLLAELDRGQYLADEDIAPSRNTIPTRQSSRTRALFTARTIGGAPRSIRSRNRRVPVDPDIPYPVSGQFEQADRFIMVLGKRDTRQVSGYSREIYVPLEARDDHPRFWGWPNRFSIRRRSLGGRPLTSAVRERWLRVNIPTRGEPFRVDPQFRVWYYPGRSEFRLNSSMLIRGARPGDLLLLEKAKPNMPYAYVASVIPKRHPLYRTFRPRCTRQPQQSKNKLYGYA